MVVRMRKAILPVHAADAGHPADALSQWRAPSKEELMKPGGIYPVMIRLTNTAITFRKGHKVRQPISSSNYPKSAPNRNDGGPMYGREGGMVTSNSVYYAAGHPSALMLPVAGR